MSETLPVYGKENSVHNNLILKNIIENLCANYKHQTFKLLPADAFIQPNIQQHGVYCPTPNMFQTPMMGSIFQEFIATKKIVFKYPQTNHDTDPQHTLNFIHRITKDISYFTFIIKDDKEDTVLNVYVETANNVRDLKDEDISISGNADTAMFENIHSKLHNMEYVLDTELNLCNDWYQPHAPRYNGGKNAADIINRQGGFRYVQNQNPLPRSYLDMQRHKLNSDNIIFVRLNDPNVLTTDQIYTIFKDIFENLTTTMEVYPLSTAFDQGSFPSLGIIAHKAEDGSQTNCIMFKIFNCFQGDQYIVITILPNGFEISHLNSDKTHQVLLLRTRDIVGIIKNTLIPYYEIYAGDKYVIPQS